MKCLKVKYLYHCHLTHNRSVYVAVEALSPINVVTMTINVIPTVVTMATLISDPHYPSHCHISVKLD